MSAMNRLLKGISSGAAVGADELGRYLSPEQRRRLLARLSADAEARAADALAAARVQAAAILADAEAAAEAIREQARTDGYAAGYAQGHAEGRAHAEAELARTAALLRRAAEAGEAIRLALLMEAEGQAVALAVAAARRVVGAAAEQHAALAAAVVREGLRSTTGRLLRVRVHPGDVEAVSVALQEAGITALAVADRAIEAGGCIIDVEGGCVDLRLSVQLDAVERLLTADTPIPQV
jgi:flagellar assembly protein FliH